MCELLQNGAVIGERKSAFYLQTRAIANSGERSS
jgi:hypothetical protein